MHLLSVSIARSSHKEVQFLLRHVNPSSSPTCRVWTWHPASMLFDMPTRKLSRSQENLPWLELFGMSGAEKNLSSTLVTSRTMISQFGTAVVAGNYEMTARRECSEHALVDATLCRYGDRLKSTKPSSPFCPLLTSQQLRWWRKTLCPAHCLVAEHSLRVSRRWSRSITASLARQYFNVLFSFLFCFAQQAPFTQTGLDLWIQYPEANLITVCYVVYSCMDAIKKWMFLKKSIFICGIAISELHCTSH